MNEGTLFGELYEELYEELEQLGKLTIEAAVSERWEEVDLLLERHYQIENEIHRRYLETINIVRRLCLSHPDPRIRKIGEDYIVRVTKLAEEVAEDLYFFPERKDELIKKFKKIMNPKQE